MIKRIELKNYEGFDFNGVLIDNLGAINVLCGKNNSGKSAILRGLLEDTDKVKNSPSGHHKSIGFTLDFEEFFQFGKESYEDFTDRLSGLSFQSLMEIHQSNTIIYEHKIDSLIDLIADKADSQTRTPIRGDIRSKLLPRLKYFLENKAKKLITDIALIPTIRNPDLEKCSFNPSQVQHGTGYEKKDIILINSLFFYKNQNIGSELLEKYITLKRHFKAVTNGVDFDVIYYKPTEASVMLLNINFLNEKGTEWYDSSKCGSGLVDILVILSFIIFSTKNIILIEEPETHLHPETQRRLLSVLHETSKTQNKQFIIASHSNVFLDFNYVDQLYQVVNNGSISVQDFTSKALLLNDLGYSISENLTSDLVILVEGPTDKPVIEEFLVQLGLYSAYSIKVWALGGNIMANQDLSVFSENYKVIALIDQDPESNDIREQFITNCTNNNIDVHRLKRYSIENYFTLNALKKVFKDKFPNELTQIDEKVPLKNQLNFDIKKYNRTIAKEISFDKDIKETDLGEFFLKVEKLLRIRS